MDQVNLLARTLQARYIVRKACAQMPLVHLQALCSGLHLDLPPDALADPGVEEVTQTVRAGTLQDSDRGSLGELLSRSDQVVQIAHACSATSQLMAPALHLATFGYHIEPLRTDVRQRLTDEPDRQALQTRLSADVPGLTLLGRVAGFPPWYVAYATRTSSHTNLVAVVYLPAMTNNGHALELFEQQVRYTSVFVNTAVRYTASFPGWCLLEGISPCDATPTDLKQRFARHGFELPDDACLHQHGVPRVFDMTRMVVRLPGVQLTHNLAPSSTYSDV